MSLKSLIPVFLTIAILAACGCTGTQTAPQPAAGTTATAQAAAQTTASLTTGPTEVMPSYNAVTVDVGEKDYLGVIPVIFQGGMGLAATKKIEVTLTRVDGSVETATIGTNKGDMVELQGTRGEGSNRGQSDRIEVRVTMNNGQTYKIADVLREYRTR